MTAVMSETPQISFRPQRIIVPFCVWKKMCKNRLLKKQMVREMSISARDDKRALGRHDRWVREASS